MVTGVAVVAAVLTTACALRLMAGPVDLDFLKPRFLTEFDTSDGPVRVDADRLFAEWGGLREPMRVVFVGLHVTNAKKEEIATAPRVSLSFEPRSVMRGQLLPTAIVVDRPTLDAEITREGGMLKRVLAKSDSSTQGEFVDLLIEQLLAEHNYHSLLGQLDTVEVVNARVSLRDVSTGLMWIAPNAQARLQRDDAGVAVSASARFKGVTGDPIEVRLSGTYSRDRSRVSIEAGIDGLKPSMLAPLSDDVALLRGVDIALSGRLRVEASGEGEIRTIAMAITAGAGTITLPGVLAASHKVRSVNALAHIDAASHTARIDHIDVDLDGPKISMTGTGLRSEQGQAFTGRAEIKQIPVDRIGDYWPLAFAPGGRDWALANVSGGTVDVAGEFGLSIPGNDLSRLSVDRTVAFLDYRGMNVHYMPQMPELKNLSGKAQFEGGILRFDIAGATAAGLGVAGATVELTGLDGPNQHAAMRIPITGSAPAVIALLARPKLGLSRDALYDPKRLGGDVAIDLTLAFPLLNTLAVADIDIKAEAALSAFSLKGAIGAVDLTDAVGKLVYANSQLSVTGVGKFDGNAVDIAWREQFAPRAPYRQRYELKGTIPAALIAKAGFPSPEPYISGAIGVTSLVYQTAANGTSDLQGRFDLKGAKVALAPLGWTKEAGTEGQLTLALKFGAGAKLATADIEGRGNGLSAKGQVRVGPDSSIQQISISQFTLGRTDMAADWRRIAGGGVEVALRGRSLELARVLQLLKARDDIAKTTPGGAAATARENTRLTLQLDRVVLAEGSLGALNGRLDLSGERMAAADLTIGAGKGGILRIAPAGSGRTLNVNVTDFGALLKETGWLDGMVGGSLDFRGRFDDTFATIPLTGKLKIGPYRLEKVAPRAEVGTLNSAIDGLNRAGNALQQFDGLEASVTKIGDRIELKDGHTSGSSIGLTTAGIIDLAKDEAHLRGIVVPGFALNNLLSNVPLLGPLLTGGKNGGVFAISYRLDGPLDALKTDINMMAAMTPGALRELFREDIGSSMPLNPETPSNRAP
ncbi:DUF3971 domain-containing protein [Reyranella sp.]|uniref:YhdP family protein n=1 Tax=Reyranella sp. TaxID=1929291 RepID=UPI003D10FA93